MKATKKNETRNRVAGENHAAQYRAQLIWSLLVAVAVALVALQRTVGSREVSRSTASTQPRSRYSPYSPRSAMRRIPVPGNHGGTMAGSAPTGVFSNQD